MILPGSYASGFATRDGHPLYPELWRGCVFAAAPCLGPTGLTLRDWGGKQNHGTLTNLTGANAWQVHSGKYVIRSAGGTASISTGYVMSTDNLSLSLWYRRASAGAFVSVGAYDSNNSRFGFDAFSDGVIYFEVANGGLSYGSVASNDTAVHHFAAIYNGSGSTNAERLRLFIDGTQRTVTFVGTIPATIAITSPFNLCSFSTRVTTGDIDDVRLYHRLTPNQIQILASRRGIAYELAPRRRSSVQVIGGFKAAWVPRRRLIIGGGI